MMRCASSLKTITIQNPNRILNRSRTPTKLKEECEFVGVSTKGTKAKLRERLWAWDDSNVDGTKEDVVTPYEPRAKPKAKAKPGPKPKAKPGPKPKAKPGPKPKAKCASS
jgi:hypothetical protein